MLKLPKSLQTHPQSQAYQNSLQELSKPLFEGGLAVFPHIDPLPQSMQVLRGARRAGLLVGGMEKIQKSLSQQSSGFQTLERRGVGSSPKEIVRLMLVSNDGSPRFYRTAERLIKEHEPWLALAVLNVDARELGRQFFGPEASVKALLLDHKEWVCRFLESWLEETRTNG